MKTFNLKASILKLGKLIQWRLWIYTISFYNYDPEGQANSRAREYIPYILNCIYLELKQKYISWKKNYDQLLLK